MILLAFDSAELKETDIFLECKIGLQRILVC